MPKITRGFYISLLAVVGILAAGGFLFRDSEAASQAVVVVALVVGFTLLNVIDYLDSRREKGRE
jgi:hypothetical protein